MTEVGTKTATPNGVAVEGILGLVDLGELVALVALGGLGVLGELVALGVLGGLVELVVLGALGAIGVLTSEVFASSANTFGFGVVEDINEWFTWSCYIVRTNRIVRHRTLFDDLLAVGVGLYLHIIHIQYWHVHHRQQMAMR